MSRITGLIPRVMKNRMHGRTLQEIEPEQYGFIPDKGTRNAIFVLRRMSGRANEKQKGIYACFIGYSKAFDTERQEPLINLLQVVDVESHAGELLADLYWKQKVVVRHNGEISEWMSI